MVHYAVMNAYKPLLVSGYVNNGSTVNIVITSDLNEELDTDIVIEVVAWDKGVILSQNILSSFQVNPLDSITVYTDSLINLLGVCQSSKDCFIRLSANTTSSDGSELSSRSYVFPTVFKNASLPHSSVDISEIKLLDEDDDGLASTASFLLSSNNTAVFVTAETNHTLLPGRFSDNSLILLSSESPQSLLFYANKGVRFSADDLFSNLTVRNLDANPME